MEHSFDIDIAKEVGINAAILYKNIQFWCAKNKANETHFHDGYYWTYNSKKAFAELFPYMTERQIEYALKKLVDANLIMKGNYNTSPYDKTNWYTDKTTNVVDGTNLCDGTNSDVQPIPYNKQSNKNTNTLSKDSVCTQASETFDFGKPKPTKKTNQNEYDKAIDLVKTRYSNPKLVSVLTDYVTGKKEQAGKLRHRFSSVTIKTYLDELDEICESDSEKIEAVRLSINYNFTSKVMKPFTNSSDNGKSNIDRITHSENGVTHYEDEDQSFMEGLRF